MPQDDFGRLLGTSAAPTEIVTANGNGTGVDVGPPPRMVQVVLRVGGAVTGTSPTLDLAIQESTTLAGSYTAVTAFPQLTATAAYTSDISGDNVKRVTFTTSKRFVRITKTIGGTASPTFNAVSAYVVAPAGGVAAT